ncbi:hypothetical protein LWC33_30140 [Pseudonocardia sp. RS11V-5]|uniref:hypothetical protein n=1 Tax=Pseudonocardia terrae TaxID=2905831 RepID=UPI001E37559F|nr:hypothetical protein [Pseudonocardia terrae]MCE3555692.1 hypothetical protein [Pseudonocardia terrae]
MEEQILELRATTRRGPVFLAGQLGLVASTVGRVLRRHNVAPLTTDPITSEPVRRRHSGIRYERRAPPACCTAAAAPRRQQDPDRRAQCAVARRGRDLLVRTRPAAARPPEPTDKAGVPLVLDPDVVLPPQFGRADAPLPVR